MSENPYEPSAPAVETPATSEVAYESATDWDYDYYAPAVSTAETLAARYWAGTIDNVLALIVTLVAAKSISDRYPALQVAVFLSAYFLYFLISEGLTGRTIGKLLVGLVVIQFNGRRITWRQALVRTVLRLFEVNPAILGGLPAGICAWRSKYHQRIGDHLAGTIVVRSWRWRNFKKRVADGTASEPIRRGKRPERVR